MDSFVHLVDSHNETRADVTRLLTSLEIAHQVYHSNELIDGIDPGPGCILCHHPGQTSFAPDFRLPTIFYTAAHAVQASVEAMKLGAMFVLELPLGKNRLQHIIEEACLVDRLYRERTKRMQDRVTHLSRLSSDGRRQLLRQIVGRNREEIAEELGVSVSELQQAEEKFLSELRQTP